MINDMQLRLKPTNKKAKVAFSVLGACALIAFVAYYYMRNNAIDKASLVGLLGLVFLTASLTFYTKYMSAVYYYEIMHDAAGTPLFIVKQAVGKRISTLCRIALYEIIKIERTEPGERKAHKTADGHRKYSYIPTFMPNITYRLTVKSRYEKSEIYIEISDEFAEVLKGYTEEARASVTDEDE